MIIVSDFRVGYGFKFLNLIVKSQVLSYGYQFCYSIVILSFSMFSLVLISRLAIEFCKGHTKVKVDNSFVLIFLYPCTHSCSMHTHPLCRWTLVETRSHWPPATEVCHFGHHTSSSELLLMSWLTYLCFQPLADTISLVPRPSPSFPSLTVLQATGSWARAWEQG